MKLVDILARELKVWPEGSSCDYCCQSDSSTEVFFGYPAGSIFLSERADETENVTVTHAQWQAAVDALKAEKVVEWTGEGLPPVGTVCEMSIGDPAEAEWFVGTVVVHIDLDRPVAVAHNGEDVFHGYAEDFRPIRTPEQIEPQEIQKIRESIGWKRPQLGACPFEQMYLLGYRKFEIVDN